MSQSNIQLAKRRVSNLLERFSKLSQDEEEFQHGINENFDNVEDFFYHALTMFDQAIGQVERSELARKNTSSTLIE